LKAVLIDLRPPLQEQEQPLCVFVGGDQDGIPRVEAGEGGAPGERSQVLRRLVSTLGP
jgi:hypothetical protein